MLRLNKQRRFGDLNMAGKFLDLLKSGAKRLATLLGMVKGDKARAGESGKT